jgi:hypothetical protein
MRVIIAGSRTIHRYDILLEMIEECGWNITTVLSGGAKGVDALGERYADEMNIKLEVYPADWKKHGKAAGPIRNRMMAERADGLIAIMDGYSRGTGNMIETAAKLGLPNIWRSL